MKTTLLSVLCLFISGWGSMQTALAQNLQEMEKSLSAINEELNQKTKEYSWQLVSAYADYCEANNKYISWNDVLTCKRLLNITVLLHWKITGLSIKSVKMRWISS